MRIACIALSGVRAVDPDLLALGLNLPGFVERSQVIASLPSLGLLTLAGLSADHQVSYHEAPDLSVLPNLPTAVDLVAISALSAQIADAYHIADHYRAQGVRVVIGGLHVSSLPEEAAAHADAVVVGQGETVWPRLLTDAEADRLQPRYTADAAATPLVDEPPMPAFHLLDIERYNRLTVQTQRGCPHRCDFCASSILISQRYQQKSIERVLAEIDRIRSIWPEPFIEFADDNSVIDRRWWRAFLPELAKRKIKWFTETDVSVAQDAELLELMRASGCRQLLLGLESPDAETLEGIEYRNNWKARQARHYRDAVARIQAAGITVNACFVLGLDHHDAGCFSAVETFIERAAPFEVQITLMTAFPGTPLYQRLAAEDRLLHPGDWSRCTLFDPTIRPRRMSVEELRHGFHDLMRRLYADDAVAWRRDRFFQQLRQAH